MDGTASDSMYDAANKNDTLAVPQKKMDSLNHAFLDSLTNHMDTNNAEFGEHH